MCVSRCVRVAIVTTRTYALQYRSALPSEFLLVFHSLLPHGTLPVFSLCAFDPLHLCAFAPLFCSRLSALLFFLLVSLRCSSLCSALLVSSPLCTPLCCALHVSGLLRLCSEFTRRLSPQQNRSQFLLKQSTKGSQPSALPSLNQIRQLKHSVQLGG